MVLWNFLDILPSSWLVGACCGRPSLPDRYLGFTNWLKVRLAILSGVRAGFGSALDQSDCVIASALHNEPADVITA